MDDIDGNGIKRLSVGCFLNCNNILLQKKKVYG